MSFLLKRRSSKPHEEATTTEQALQKPIGAALVIGGGPAGALAAKALADRNFATTLCEAYPHPSGSTEKRHSYVISLQSRGISALRRVGVDPFPDLNGVANYAYVRHGSKPESKARVIKKDDANIIVRRQKLTSDLLNLAEQSGATIACGEKLTDIDFDKRIATFTNTQTHKEIKHTYDLLIAADGVRSVTRTLLEERGHLGPTRKEADDMEYQVATLPKWKELLSPSAAGDVEAPDASVHTWANRKANANSLVFPLEDNKSLVCVICPGGKLDELKKDPTGYGPFLQGLYPNWTEEARSNLAKQLAEEDNVPTTGGTCIWTSSLAAPKAGVVLLGDSGHGMWPSLGQGCNAALESVSVLADAVEAVCGDSTGQVIPSAGAGVRKTDVWELSTGERGRLVAQEFNGLRHDDALAVVDLTFSGIGSRRTRGAQNGKVLFFLQMAIMMLLNKASLGLVPKPALFQVMAGGQDLPYSTLLWQNKCEKAATQAIVTVLAMAAVAYFYQ